MKRILAIEDDRMTRNLLLKILKSEKFEVTAADNGTLGVQLAIARQPDLILCDIMMPAMDGYEVLAAVRETPETAAIPFIFLTAKTQRSDMRKGMELGADDYITKPFASAELLGAIAAQFKKRSLLEQRLQYSLERQQNFLEKPEKTKKNSWSTEKLYADLATAKQQQRMAGRRLQLTALEKACLQGLLNGSSPSDLATQLNREPKGLAVDLSRGLYRYIESVTGNSPKNWRDIPVLLEKAGYKTTIEA